MADSLSSKFNLKSAFFKTDKRGKIIKSEEDFAIGKYKLADGTMAAVRNGKFVGPITDSKTDIQKLNTFRKAAVEAVARKQQAARVHRKPAGAPVP
jgi:hypothetical protein